MTHTTRELSAHRITAACVVAAASLVLVPATPAAAAVQATLYASPTGSGAACTLAAPCSITGAQSVVRTLTATMTGDIVVNLLGGTYAISDTLRFEVQDSGRNGHTVVYQAQPGQTPVISGATRVTGWSLHDASRDIYRATVPAGSASGQLFVDGQRAQRARTAAVSGFTLSGSSFVTSDPSYRSFTNPSQVQVVQDNQWKHLRCPLSSITASGSGSSLNVNPACFSANNTNVPNVGFPINGAGLPKLDSVTWVENAYQLLDQPGEFYLDTVANLLYYIPRPGQNMASADVELPRLQQLVDVSGTPGHLMPVMYDAPGASYTGSWSVSTGRTFGDLGNAVKFTATNGASASFTFTGSGLQVLSETNTDEGSIDVYVDGTKTQTVSAYSTTRLAQQVIVNVSGLSQSQHTVKLVKTGGQYMLVNGYVVTPTQVQPVHDITFSGITFQHTRWTQPDVSGYVDNQAGVLWNPSNSTTFKVPAAVQVHRGQRIAFSRDVITHLGGAGIDLADGTQDSSVTGSWISDISAGGVAIGEVDDYYLTDPALMTSGDTISQNTVTFAGRDYHDVVGILAGYTRNLAISNNDLGYVPYSGISVGWGWGWQSDCSLQAAQGLSVCRHGTNYARSNQILNNYVHNVMATLWDGGQIYTNGGQGGSTGVASGPCQATSTAAGNVLAGGIQTLHVIYHDEGSSCWDTHDNVVQNGGDNWVGMWTPTINNISLHDNFSDNAAYYNHGTNITFNQATIVTGGAWPSAARSIMADAGVDAQHAPVTGRADDDALEISYTGSWFHSGYRGFGDFNDGVHATAANGDSASLTFTGTGVQVIGETNSDQGNLRVYVDGIDKGTVSTYSAARAVQQVVYSISGLGPGSHTITIVKSSGSYTTIDAFEVTRAINDTDSAVSYATSWFYSAARGYGDHGDDVHATTVDGDFVTVVFYGTGITFYTEKNADGGTIAVTLDGVTQGTVNAFASSRSSQQVLYAVSGLPAARHTLALTKSGGTYMVVDRFDIV